MVFAMERAMGTYKNKQKYAKLRENAFKGTMSGDVVSKAWLAEFYRLRGKIYCDPNADTGKEIEKWTPEDYKPINILQELFGINRISKEEVTFKDMKEIDNGAADSENKSQSTQEDFEDFMSSFDKTAFSLAPYSFQMHNYGPQHEKV